MDSIKYLRLDLRLMKGYLKIYLAMPLFLVWFVFTGMASLALNYLFFLVIIISSTPFSLEGVGGSQKLYYMLPARIKSMVLGRYIFLYTAIAIVIAIETIADLYFLSINKITVQEILFLFISVLVGSIICFIQYPIFYKFGYEKGRLSSLLIYMIPVMTIFILPSILPQIISKNNIENLLLFSQNNLLFTLLIGMVLLVLCAYASFMLSYRICRMKEI